MITRQFGSELLQIWRDRERIKAILNQPITAGMCDDTHILTLLGERLLMWPTFDLRYIGISNDSALLKDIVKGMETNIIRRDLNASALVLSVEIPANLGEYEKFNMLAEDHNRQWIRNGRRTHVLDPVHGDVYEVKDQMVDPALLHSRTNPVPHCQANVGVQEGTLSRMRPTLRRRTFATITYQVWMYSGEFTLGYAAYNSKKEVVYYNQQSHTDLAVLIRKSIQEIWGNPYELKETGKVLEGISLLTQGRKLQICQRDNELPNFLSSLEIKKGVREVDIIEGGQNFFRVANVLSGYGVPVVSFFLAIAIFWELVMGVNNENLNGSSILLKIFGVIVMVIISRFVSRWSERQVSVLGAEKSLL